eukprot:m.701397 g.701397  ORF g.701397 m.701397 type:complete len:144 (-) comp22913_c1_seq9:1353-1784(-)
MSLCKHYATQTQVGWSEIKQGAPCIVAHAATYRSRRSVAHRLLPRIPATPGTSVSVAARTPCAGEFYQTSIRASRAHEQFLPVLSSVPDAPSLIQSHTSSAHRRCECMLLSACLHLYCVRCVPRGQERAERSVGGADLAASAS